jgi:hypothetical protein
MHLPPHQPSQHEHQTDHRGNGHHDHYHGMRHAPATAAFFVLRSQRFGIELSGFARTAVLRILIRTALSPRNHENETSSFLPKAAPIFSSVLIVGLHFLGFSSF